MRIYEEKQIHTGWNPYNNEKFYMVLVAENELRIFHHFPKQIKVWETVDGVPEDFGQDYGLRLPLSTFSEKIQSMLKINRVISLGPHGEINIELDS